ncbi:MAG: FG-GAP-like repeat-containing protein [Pirellulales bacterium]
MAESSSAGWIGRGRGLRLGAVLLALSAVVLLVSWLSTRNDISPDECRRLESLKNVAIGYLEGGRLAADKLSEADQVFSEIAEKMPHDPLGHRNLTITRLIRLEQNRITPAEAVQAAERMLAVESESPEALLLAAKVFLAAGDNTRAAAEASRARQLAPEDPTAAYAFFEAAKNIQGREEQAREILAQAYDLDRDNIFLLAVALRELGTAKDGRIMKTLSGARQAVQPIAASVREQTRLDPLELLATVDAAAQKGDHTTVFQLSARLANVILPSVATQIDRRRVDKDRLEYVLHEFGPRYCPRPAAPPIADESPRVVFKPLPADRQLPVAAGVVDLKLADFDLDGLADAILLRESSVEVYSRVADGRTWQRVTQAAVPAGFDQLLLADLDQDDPKQPGSTGQEAGEAARPAQPPEQQDTTVAGQAACQNADVDVVVYGPAGIILLANQLDTTTEGRVLNRVVQAPEFDALRGVLAVIAADVLHDGDLDLVVSSGAGLSLWSNRGDMTFYDISSRSKLPDAALQGTALVSVDLDRDVDLDVVIAGPTGRAGYLENLKHGQLRWQPLESGFEALESASSLALLDADADGSWDLASAGERGLKVVLARLSRSGVLQGRATRTLAEPPHAGVATCDFDNDGLLDLVAWSETGLDVYRGLPEGEWRLMPRLVDAAPKAIRAVGVADLDGDGDQDLAVASADRVVLLDNDGGNSNHWLSIELRAGITDQQTRSFRVNHSGLGSVIELRAGARRQRQVVSGQKTHFGLGQHSKPDVARVIWTSGVPQNILNPDRDQVLCEEQVLIGSCPYLYAWSGEKFEFVTDCLWSAPLGLQLAEGIFAPAREWEYLRIGGDQLVPRDGHYDLRITEELWEAAYLDQVQLIAVDHPAGVEIYSNEKVGPAEIAEFKVHTVARPRTPLAARDQRGRDVLDRVGRRDGEYLKAFDRKLGMGLAEEHALELDFGSLENPQQITLFLTGWIFPTGSSMNVGISRHPELESPKPPALYVPDASGQWRLAQAYMGFPGGKTKTIAVDLSDAFVNDDYRVRIVTNMEIYWDEAFFSVDEEPVSVKLTPLELASAELDYRGFSRRTPDEGFGPEHFDYDRVSPEPKWPAMTGHFTRYGPVDELLDQTDDLLVVMGAGDELSLRFKAPAGDPPAGWKRDFLLYNVGWDKDADLNTVYGEQVEPLPFLGMSGYPYGADEAYPTTPRHLDYLRRYQTRRQNTLDFWRQVLDWEPAD